MALKDPVAVVGKKRKRATVETPAKQPKNVRMNALDEIDRLESEITESRKHYNNIARLLATATSPDSDVEVVKRALLALSRTFTRVYADGGFQGSRGAGEAEKKLRQWLEQRLDQFSGLLKQELAATSSAHSVEAVTYLVRLVKHEVDLHGQDDWTSGIFADLIQLLLSDGAAEEALDHFITAYFSKFDDVRYHTLAWMGQGVKHSSPKKCAKLLFSLGTPPTEDQAIENFLCPNSAKFRKTVASRKAHRKRGQEAWLAYLSAELSDEPRTKVLRSMVHDVVPWFPKVERLMDFLSDSFDQGGETSLLALSGLFYLMQEKNLDYPLFYQKLYSLLDQDLLHSKYRSRFFRLLDTFMASTHLPVNLVASFIKRLSRLALHAPPGGIVLVIPWIYNMFKRHPTSTFMMHRESRSAEQREQWEKHGVKDTFDMNEADPMKSGAIDSDVWELVTLQSHYHPNVATLAKIMSEPFTKQSYNLEDFLDHTYDSLLGPELDREPKRSAVVEYEIPKSILADDTYGLGASFQLIVNDSS